MSGSLNVFYYRGLGLRSVVKMVGRVGDASFLVPGNGVRFGGVLIMLQTLYVRDG